MKKIIIGLVLMCAVSQIRAQNNPFPNVDSLVRFINKYIRNSAVDAFTNLRLNTALQGTARFADSALNFSTRGVDTIYRTPGKDSIIFKINGTRYALKDSTGGGGGDSSFVGTSGILKSIAGAIITFKADTTLLSSRAWRDKLKDSVVTLLAGKQPQLNGTGFVKATGTTISYDNATYQSTSEKNANNGYAGLNSSGKVAWPQLDSNHASGIVSWPGLLAQGYGTGGGGSGTDSTFNKLGMIDFIAAGGHGDGLIVQDASISSGSPILTTSATVFTLFDIGKSVMVSGAGTSGARLYATITGFTNSHSVTISINASTTVSNKELDYGTDNTVILQGLINANLNTLAGRNKKIYVSQNGHYFFFGPIVHSAIDGSDPASQIYVPLQSYTNPDSLGTISIIGVSPPHPYTDYTLGQAPPETGVIFQSVRRDSGYAFIAGAYETVAWGYFTFCKFTLENILIRTCSRVNGVDVKPIMAAVDFQRLALMGLKNVRIDTQSPQNTSVAPDSCAFGLRTPLNNNFVDIMLDGIIIQNYHTGAYVNEHTTSKGMFIVATCKAGIDYGASFHPSHIFQYKPLWCQDNIRISGATRFIIDEMAIENYPSSASVKWFNHRYDIYEGTHLGASGKIAYTRVESGTGLSPDLDLSDSVDLNVLTTMVGEPSPRRIVSGLNTYYGSISNHPYNIFALENNSISGTGSSQFTLKRNGVYQMSIGSDLAHDGSNNIYIMDHAGFGAVCAYWPGDGGAAFGNNAVTSPLLYIDANGGLGIGGNALSAPNYKFGANPVSTTTPALSLSGINFQNYTATNQVFGFNTFVGAGGFTYVANGAATYIQSATGDLLFGSMASGTAGTAGSNITNMVIKNDGKIGVGGNTSPAISFITGATDAWGIPTGTTAQRPTGAAAYTRWNSDSVRLEVHTGGGWKCLAYTSDAGTGGIDSATADRIARRAIHDSIGPPLTIANAGSTGTSLAFAKGVDTIGIGKLVGQTGGIATEKLTDSSVLIRSPIRQLGDYYDDFVNTSTTETNGYSYDIDQNVNPFVDGDKFFFTIQGTFVGSATATRTVKAYFGGTQIFSSGGLTNASASSWELRGWIIRVGSTTARCSVTMLGGSLSNVVESNLYTEVTGLDFTSPVTFLTTLQAGSTGAATNDIIERMANFEYKVHNTIHP